MGGWGTGVPLSIPQCTEWSSQNHPTPNVNSAKVKKLLWGDGREGKQGDDIVSVTYFDSLTYIVLSL